MNWQSLRFDWNHARAVLATAELGSLQAAADALGMTQPTVSRQVSAFEEDLDMVIFERVGRKLVITPQGQALCNHLETMRDGALAFSLSATGFSESLEGIVRITASDVFSATYLPQFLVNLRRAAPNLTVEIVAADDLQDLQRREADIAVRHVRPDQPELFARLVGNAAAGIYGSESHVEAIGMPKTKAEMSNHRFIGFTTLDRMLGYLNAMGLDLTHDHFPFLCNDGNVVHRMTKAGLGLAPISDSLARQIGGLRRVAVDLDHIEFPVWLTTHRELHTSRKIRLVFDMLYDYLKAQDLT